MDTSHVVGNGALVQILATCLFPDSGLSQGGRGVATPGVKMGRKVNTVEPGYNDIGLYDTTSIASDILWYQLIPHLTIITLFCSVITTQSVQSLL